MAANISRTCWASRRGVEPISLSLAPTKGSSTPSLSGVTRVGGGCSDRPEGGPPCAQRHFNQHSPIEGPVSREAAPRGRVETTRGGDEGGGVTTYSILPSLEDVELVGPSSTISLLPNSEHVDLSPSPNCPCGPICGRSRLPP
jgi:hypothetical protein